MNQHRRVLVILHILYQAIKFYAEASLSYSHVPFELVSHVNYQ